MHGDARWSRWVDRVLVHFGVNSDVGVCAVPIMLVTPSHVIAPIERVYIGVEVVGSSPAGPHVLAFSISLAAVTLLNLYKRRKFRPRGGTFGSDTSIPKCIFLSW